MSFITGKQLPRRTFLRGAGATVALPFLDAMVPAGRLLARAPRAHPPGLHRGGARPGRLQRLGGVEATSARPATTGTDFELVADNPLKPLEPYRDYLTIISNTDVRMAEAFAPPEIGGDHFRSSAVFLTQSHPKQTQGSDI